MKLNDIMEIMKKTSTMKNPVILLEGTRNITSDQYKQLSAFGSFIAAKFPNAYFRSGNATGSDEAFAEGVRKVAPNRMQIVLPKMNSGKARMKEQDYKVALEHVSIAEEKKIIYESKQATPSNKRLFEMYENKTEGVLMQKSLYLLRDTLKVLGSKANNLEPIAVGIFFTNELNPESGGTGHTMRVCRQNNVPVITQDVWLNWLQ